MPTALTTPIVIRPAESATQYELVRSSFDFDNRFIEVNVNLIDAAGDIVRASIVRLSFADVGISITLGNTIRAAIVAKLRELGTVN